MTNKKRLFRDICFNEYQYNIYKCCNIMSPKKYYLLISNCPDLTKAQCKKLYKQYKNDLALLNADLHINYNSICSNVLLGGGSTEEENFKEAAASYKEPSVQDKKAAYGSRNSPDWQKECPKDYNKKKKCVQDPVSKECIDEKDIAGDDTGSAFSDGHCYSSTKLQNHAYTQYLQKKPFLKLPSGKKYSKSDYNKFNKTRLSCYAQFSLLSSITSSVEDAINSTSSSQQKSFEEYIKNLKEEHKKTSQIWKVLGKFAQVFLKAIYKAGKYLASQAISLGRFIVSSPKTARMMLFMVKGLIDTFCQKIAIFIGKARYKHKGYAERAYDAVTSESMVMVAEQVTASFFTGGGFAKLSSGLGRVAAGTLTSLVPGLGGAITAIGQEIAGPINEAAKFAAETALYQQDVNKSFGSVLDIIAIVVDPVRCLNKNAIIITSNQALDGQVVDNHSSEDTNNKKGWLWGGKSKQKKRTKSKKKKKVKKRRKKKKRRR